MFSLLHCLLLPSPSFYVEFQVGVLAPADFRYQIFPCEDLQPVAEFGILVFAVLFHLHAKSLEIHQ